MAVGSGATGVTIVGICGRIAVKLGMSLKTGHEIGQFVSYFYFIIVISYCVYRKESWKSVTLLTSLMIIFVAASGTYCLVYCVIPFVCPDFRGLSCAGNGVFRYAVYILLFVACRPAD